MQVQGEDKPYDDINITPMLDLAYVLLVIFILMCTASVAGTKVNLPKASSTAGNLAKAKTKAITVNNQGKVFLDTVPVSLQELEQKLTQQKAQTSDFPVVIRGDAVTQYQSVMDVLDIVGRIGITRVGLATKRSSGGEVCFGPRGNMDWRDDSDSGVKRGFFWRFGIPVGVGIVVLVVVVKLGRALSESGPAPQMRQPEMIVIKPVLPPPPPPPPPPQQTPPR